mmetsp:Transcript_3530/g.10161  ORF Transcript_3530/g.10161 Transcript_3530/m.10161 type:complete len:229 (+) Transcript_3530:2093-2779(+)
MIAAGLGSLLSPSPEMMPRENSDRSLVAAASSEVLASCSCALRKRIAGLSCSFSLAIMCCRLTRLRSARPQASRTDCRTVLTARSTSAVAPVAALPPGLLPLLLLARRASCLARSKASLAELSRVWRMRARSCEDTASLMIALASAIPPTSTRHCTSGLNPVTLLLSRTEPPSRWLISSMALLPLLTGLPLPPRLSPKSRLARRLALPRRSVSPPRLLLRRRGPLFPR